jgi:hypothetical protein
MQKSVTGGIITQCFIITDSENQSSLINYTGTVTNDDKGDYEEYSTHDKVVRRQ